MCRKQILQLVSRNGQKLFYMFVIVLLVKCENSGHRDMSLIKTCFHSRLHNIQKLHSCVSFYEEQFPSSILVMHILQGGPLCAQNIMQKRNVACKYLTLASMQPTYFIFNRQRYDKDVSSNFSHILLSRICKNC